MSATTGDPIPTAADPASTEMRSGTVPALEPRSDPRGSALRRSTVRILLVTSLYPTPDRPEVGPFVARRVRALRAGGARVHVVASQDYRHGQVRRHLGLLAGALVARGHFDGVEGHVLFPAGLAALVAAKLRGLPLVAYAHGSDVSATARRSAVHRALASLVARGSAAVVTNSAESAMHVRALGAEPLVIPPGVDMTRFGPISGEARARARDALGIASTDRLALFVGALATHKGADLFGQAVTAAKGWRGVFVGGGELGPELAGRFPGIRQVGPVAPDAVPAWLQVADVVVVPSRREGLGLVAVEALACGVPVVASAVGGLLDVVRDGENGLLSPLGDAVGLARALDRLADVRFRDQLASGARASVAGHDIEATTRAMAALWRSLGVGG